MSDSPRESSVTFSGAVLSPTRLNGLTEEPEDSQTPTKSEDPDDIDIDEVKLEPSESSLALQLAPPRRPRGRPRKHPKPEQGQSPKITKARSKTGCKTCRRRKKKCDEAKPFCRNCETNNVVCEGYPEKTYWVSGTQKTKRRHLQQWHQSGPIPLPQYIQGLDTDIDWKFYYHYEHELSKRLNLKPDDGNPFVVIVVPMAQAHLGVMHALLACSGSHYLQRMKGVAALQEYEDRQSYHKQAAYNSIATEHYADDSPEPQKDASVMCSALLLYLRTIVDGDTSGEWRFHEKYFSDVLQGREEPRAGESIAAWNFCKEFYHYHRMSSFITCADRPDDEEPLQVSLSVANRDNGDNFMSVCEGLELPTRKIHFLRRKIRERRMNGLSPDVTYAFMEEGKLIDTEIKQLECRHEIGSDQWICWNLYHSCMWLILQRTIMSGPDPPPHFLAGVTDSLKYLETIEDNSPLQSVLVTPVFILGCCAYEHDIRPSILNAFTVLENYSHNGNIRHARDIVQTLWELMDNGDKKAWDYESVMRDMNIDTLLT